MKIAIDVIVDIFSREPSRTDKPMIHLRR